MPKINKIRLSNIDYNIEDENAVNAVELTQAQYDALVTKDPNVFYIITDAQAGDLSDYYTKDETDDAIEAAVNIVQVTGNSTTSIMSQNAVTTNFNNKADASRLGGLSFVKVTQAQYDAITTKDNNTIYFING